MKFNRKGLIARFYRWFGDHRDLPPDFCTYFWGLLWRILACLGGVLFIAVIVIIISGLLFNFFKFASHHKLAVGSVMIGVASAGLWLWISKRNHIKIEVFDEAKEIVKVKFHSFKDKYCPRIDWE